MPSYKRPGVFVEETLSPADARAGAGGTSACFIGAYQRGNTSPTFVDSFTTFTNLYGSLNPSYELSFAVFTYFGNGGSGCWISRVVGSGAATASLTLADRAGTPAATLVVNAANPGSWGNQLYIAVTDTGLPGRFDLGVYYGGTSVANLVEIFQDVAVSITDSRYVCSLVNSQSKYINVVDQFSASTAPNNVPAARLATAGNAVLSGGVDGSAPTASDYLNAAQGFDTVQGPLVINVPGISSTSTMNGIVTYAEGRGDAFVVIDPGVSRTPSQIVTDFTGATSSSYGAVYYPRIKILDPIANVPNVQRTIAPGGAILGSLMRTDVQFGPFRAPAGTVTGIIPAIDVERLLTPTDLDNLNSSTPPVNVIRPVPNSGICVMGARTLKPGYSDRYINVRRSLIYLRKSLIDLTQFAVFAPNDDRLWSQIRSVCNAFLQQYYQKGGLRGATSRDAFYVKCDSSINTPASIAAGIVNIEIGVAVQYPAEFVVIRLGQFDGGAAAIEVN